MRTGMVSAGHGAKNEKTAIGAAQALANDAAAGRVDRRRRHVPSLSRSGPTKSSLTRIIGACGQSPRWNGSSSRTSPEAETTISDPAMPATKAAVHWPADRFTVSSSTFVPQADQPIASCDFERGKQTRRERGRFEAGFAAYAVHVAEVPARALGYAA